MMDGGEVPFYIRFEATLSLLAADVFSKVCSSSLLLVSWRWRRPESPATRLPRVSKKQACACKTRAHELSLSHRSRPVSPRTHQTQLSRPHH